VYAATVTGEAAATGSYSTVFTTGAAGIYRMEAYIWATTQSTTAYVVGVATSQSNTGQVGTGAFTLNNATIGTTAVQNAYPAPAVYTLASGVNMTIGTFTLSGSNTSGVWSRTLVITRYK
jgi:hypothetical protein